MRNFARRFVSKPVFTHLEMWSVVAAAVLCNVLAMPAWVAIVAIVAAGLLTTGAQRVWATAV